MESESAIIIASLNSRVEELESMLAEERDLATQREATPHVCTPTPGPPTPGPPTPGPPTPGPPTPGPHVGTPTPYTDATLQATRRPECSTAEALRKIEILQAELAVLIAKSANDAKTIWQLNEEREDFLYTRSIMIGNNNSLSSSLERTRSELNNVKNLKYCKLCGEHTRHWDTSHNTRCIQCCMGINISDTSVAVSEHNVAPTTTDTPAPTTTDTPAHIPATTPMVTTPMATTPMATTTPIPAPTETVIDSRDEALPDIDALRNEFTIKIFGYQKVILALTDKLAEAYGVDM